MKEKSVILPIPEHKEQSEWKQFGFCPNCERVQPMTRHGRCQVCDSKFINQSLGMPSVVIKDDSES